MKEYAFTKWLIPTLQTDGTERDMVYNEQMGIFTVRGENQFQKGSIDTQHTVSLLVLKGEISIQTNDKRTVIPAPSYIEFIEPHQWSDLKTDRDFEGCLLITRREIFYRQPNASVPRWLLMYTDTYWNRLFHWRNRIFSGYNHI